MRFGTDGVRAVANTELTPELALALGRAAARRLGTGVVFVGRDTRVSGTLLEAALCAGLASEGVDVRALGVCPTPAVAWLAARRGVAGAMISASHNPFADNGIKLFAPGGLKLADDAQAALEHELVIVQAGAAGDRPHGAAVGQVLDARPDVAAYEDALVASIEGRSLAGARVVLDCANGAAHEIGPEVLAELGADVEVLAAAPDGVNINAGCGSTDLGPLQAAVTARGADLGLAFDGDADRVLAVDARGEVVDGDQLIAICAVDLRARGRLTEDTVVVTVMANQGFRLGMRRAGIAVHETQVGDRHVLAALEAGGWALGGEQSGHVIFRHLATTGDGILTGVQVVDLVQRAGAPLHELAAAAMRRLPQVLENVRIAAPVPGLLDALAPALEAATAVLGEEGRVLVRPSGTEPLVRVMVEAADPAAAEAVAATLVDEVRRIVG
ncbi:MAG: phosphoglucosamine mutase [Acidimicrobiia bacterium]|nr:phosphoglucosamine mutase [Acidimicrobiia bacterium]